MYHQGMAALSVIESVSRHKKPITKNTYFKRSRCDTQAPSNPSSLKRPRFFNKHVLP